MKQPTRTINRLHFTDLDPLRFEDLCLNIVSRINPWKELSHFGRSGSDLGVDIFAVHQTEDDIKTWYIQCKRYSTIGKTDITELIDKIIKNPSLPDKLLVIVACDVSRTVQQHLKEYATEQKINEIEIWTASILEAKLYKDYKDLLFTYFGISIENKTKDNSSRIKYALRMKKRVNKELIDHKFLKENKDFHLLMYKPYRKFISHEVYIRSVDDTTYPECIQTPERQISPWFRTNFYDLYHNGVEFWLSAASGAPIVMDENGFWEPIDHFDDKKRNNPKYKFFYAMLIGRVPYHHIVDFITDGDEYTSEPHLFCKFIVDGMPYEEIYYKRQGNTDKAIPDWDLDKTKRTTFPDC